VGNGRVSLDCLGYEVDAVFTNGYGPSGLADGRHIARQRWVLPPGPVLGRRVVHLVFATARSNGRGVSTTSMFPSAPTVRSAEAQAITRNVLARLAIAPLPAPTSLAAAQTGTNIKLTMDAGCGRRLQQRLPRNIGRRPLQPAEDHRGDHLVRRQQRRQEDAVFLRRSPPSGQLGECVCERGFCDLQIEWELR
jgi:hypothetical protein